MTNSKLGLPVMETMAWELTRGPRPSFDMGFDGAVNGGIYLFGDSVSLIDFIKVHVFPPSSDRQLVTAHRLVHFNNMAANMHASFIFKFKFNSDFILTLQRRSIAKC